VFCPNEFLNHDLNYLHLARTARLLIERCIWEFNIGCEIALTPFNCHSTLWLGVNHVYQTKQNLSLHIVQYEEINSMFYEGHVMFIAC